VDDRTEAILELLSGKATVEQLALRFGVHAETVEKWREVALAGAELGRPTKRQAQGGGVRRAPGRVLLSWRQGSSELSRGIQAEPFALFRYWEPC
jgi:transposase-like protein